MLGVLFLKALILSRVFTQEVTPNNTLRCGKGHFLETIGNARLCQPCPNGTYMDEDGHTRDRCKRCRTYLPELDNVAKVKLCTGDRDTVVEKCKEGFYVQYNPSKKRYDCALCKFTDCPENAECCNSDSVITTTDLTPATTFDSSTVLNPETYKHNTTKCEMVVTQGCLKAEYVNTTCVYVHDSVERTLLCQNCPNINNTIDNKCTGNLHDSYSPFLAPGPIAGIVIGCIIFIAIVVAVVVLYCCCRRRNKKQYRTYQLANQKPTDKADVEKSSTTVKFNPSEDKIVIEQC